MAFLFLAVVITQFSDDMKGMSFRSLISFILFSFAACAAQAQLPDASLFVKNPDFTQPQLSPDGTHLAILAPVGGYMNLVVMNLETKDLRPVSGEQRDVTWFEWASNTRLLYGVDAGREVTRENNNIGNTIVGVDRDGSNLDQVVKSLAERRRPGSSFGARKENTGIIQIIHPLPDDPDNVLVTSNERRWSEPDVFLMNARTGSLRRVFNNPGGINGYYVGPDGEVRLGIEVDLDRDGARTLWVRNTETGEWKSFPVSEGSDSSWDVFSVNPGSDRALVWADYKGRAAVFWMSLETGTMDPEPILSDPVYDIKPDEGATVNRGFKTGVIVGIDYERDKPTHFYLHSQYEKLQEMIDGAIPDSFNRIVSVDGDASKAVIRSFSDTKAPEYYLLDLKKMGLEFLAASYPATRELELQPTRCITYEARDGRTIHGYLILPKGYSEGHPVPLMLNPHGGPWSRDLWGMRNYFNLANQFFVSRGFAVLQMDFRGSTGYGSDHYRSSFKHPAEMNYDVFDAAEWAVEEGYADRKHISIMGASYGGYATMTALTKRPDLFEFGINIFGVVDIVKQMERYLKWDREVAYNYWVERFGDPKVPEERALLDEWSAINHIDALHPPLFIYHGLYDFNVHYEQSEMLESALKRRGWKEGKDYVFIKRKHEMHGFYNEEDRIEMYQEIDKFIKPFSPAWQAAE